MAPPELVYIVIAAAIAVLVVVRILRALASLIVPIGIAVVLLLLAMDQANAGPATARAIDTALRLLGDLYAHIVALNSAT
jgi:hypothetical protein